MMTKYFVERNFRGTVLLSKFSRGTCLSGEMLKGTYSSVGMLKGYMARKRLETPDLESVVTQHLPRNQVRPIAVDYKKSLK